MKVIQMEKIKVNLPEVFDFTTNITVQIADINYGNHLANDAVLRLCHEARLRFLQHYGFSEMDVAGCGLIMADAAIQFINQSFYADILEFNVAVSNIRSAGFALITQIRCPAKNIEIARVQNGMVFFDYQSQKIAKTPATFNSLFQNDD